MAKLTNVNINTYTENELNETRLELVDYLLDFMNEQELYDKQSAEYNESVFPSAVPSAVISRVNIEEAFTFGWGKFVGSEGIASGIDKVGASAPAPTIYKEYDITAEVVVAAAKSLL